MESLQVLDNTNCLSSLISPVLGICSIFPQQLVNLHIYAIIVFCIFEPHFRDASIFGANDHTSVKKREGTKWVGSTLDLIVMVEPI